MDLLLESLRAAKEVEHWKISTIESVLGGIVGVLPESEAAMKAPMTEGWVTDSKLLWFPGERVVGADGTLSSTCLSLC